MATRREIVKTGLILDHFQKRGSMMDDDKEGSPSRLHHLVHSSRIFVITACASVERLRHIFWTPFHNARRSSGVLG